MLKIIRYNPLNLCSLALRVHVSTPTAGIMGDHNILFEDMFEVLQKDPDGKRFDKGKLRN
jgi:hypothetical protein